MISNFVLIKVFHNYVGEILDDDSFFFLLPPFDEELKDFLDLLSQPVGTIAVPLELPNKKNNEKKLKFFFLRLL